MNQQVNNCDTYNDVNQCTQCQNGYLLLDQLCYQECNTFHCSLSQYCRNNVITDCPANMFNLNRKCYCNSSDTCVNSQFCDNDQKCSECSDFPTKCVNNAKCSDQYCIDCENSKNERNSADICYFCATVHNVAFDLDAAGNCSKSACQLPNCRICSSSIQQYQQQQQYKDLPQENAAESDESAGSCEICNIGYNRTQIPRSTGGENGIITNTTNNDDNDDNSDNAEENSNRALNTAGTTAKMASSGTNSTDYANNSANYENSAVNIDNEQNYIYLCLIQCEQSQCNPYFACIDNQCLFCKLHTTEDQTACACTVQDDCATKYFCNTTIGQCQLCQTYMSNCSTCNSQDHCISPLKPCTDRNCYGCFNDISKCQECKKGYAIVEDDLTCGVACGESEKGTESQQHTQNSEVNATSDDARRSRQIICTSTQICDTATQQCKDCKPNEIMYQNICVCGYYWPCNANEYCNNNKNCQKCLEGCVSCNDGITCIQCDQDYRLTVSRQCQSKCGGVYCDYEKQICQENQCYSCITTSNYQTSTCKCNNNEDCYFKEYCNTDHICTSCANTNMNNCELCSSDTQCTKQKEECSDFNCASCPINKTQCIKCLQGFTQNIETLQCIQICQEKLCNYDQICSVQEEKCVKCDTNETAKIGKCYCGTIICNEGQFCNRDISCISCPQNCIHCNQEQSCLTCQSNYEWKNSECVSSKAKVIKIFSISISVFLIISLISIVIVYFYINKKQKDIKQQMNKAKVKELQLMQLNIALLPG